jgi:hypothetical protein
MLKNIIICGDFNAYSLLWGNKPANRAGKCIECLISNNNNELAGAIPPNLNTYFHPKSGSFSTIDLQIVSINIFNQIYINKIDSLCTDYFAIVCSLNEPAETLSHTYTDEITSFTQNSCILNATADTCAEVLAFILINRANHAIPRTTPRKTFPKHTPKAWWTNECQNKWRTKKAAWRKFLKKHLLLHI